MIISRQNKYSSGITMNAGLQSTPHSRYETLDGMRGVAAIAVMIYHYFQFSSARIFYNAFLGVDLFFILSGFVIAHSYGRRIKDGMSTSEYIGKRFIRLYPMFLLGLVIGTPVYYLQQKAGLANSPFSFLITSTVLNLFYLPSINNFWVFNLGTPAPTVGQIFPGNAPAWSLFFEVIASLSFLVLYRFRRGGLVALVVCAFTAYLSCGLIHAHLDGRHAFDLGLGWGTEGLYGGLPRVILGFSTGMLIYSISTDPDFKAVRSFFEWHAPAPATLYVIIILAFLLPVAMKSLYPVLFLAVIAPILVYVGSIVRCPNDFSLSTARFLGWLSYPLYCLHFPIGNLVFLLVVTEAHLPKTVAVIGSILTTLLVATVSTKYFEEPARIYLTKLHSASRANRTEAQA